MIPKLSLVGDGQGCLWALGVNTTNKYLKFFVNKLNFIENFVFVVDLLVKEGRNGKLRGGGDSQFVWDRGSGWLLDHTQPL